MPVVGTFNITNFQVINGALTAVGTFTGTVNGAPVTMTDASSAVAGGKGSCQIIDLTLGPLHAASGP